MSESMMMTPTIEALSAALAAAQGEIAHAAKSSVNPHFKSDYADLAAVWDACRAPLARHGLAVTQTTRLGAGAHVLVTTLLHSSGQWLASEMPILAAKNEPQSFGSALTYARRYALAAIVGVSQADDDGEGGQGRGFAGSQRDEAPRGVPVERSPASQTKPAQRAGDAAHAALVAEFKARCAAVKELADFGPLCFDIDAAKLPPAMRHDVHAEVAVYGLKFAADAKDLDWWIEKLRGWELPHDSEPHARAAEAFAAADSRVERDAMQQGQAAA